jgi:prepilin-type N-terminal cleavage/methylation domain-containing protein
MMPPAVGSGNKEPHVRRNRRGFTMIEILVAVGIIATLTALLFLGFKYVGKSSRDNLTHTALQNLRGMLTEFEQTGGRMDDLNAIYADLIDGANIQTPLPAVPTPPVPSPLAGSIAQDGRERFGEGTIRTQRVMRRLMAVPSVKSIVDNLPPEALIKVEFQGPPNSPSLPTPTYLPGDELIVVPTKNQIDYYVCKALTKTGPPSASWQHMGNTGEPPIHHTPVLADGYRNPIWFAPLTGLGVEPMPTRPANGVNLQSNGNGSYSSPNQTILPPGWQQKTVSGHLIKLGRPFFASAGEDADFSKGDDNHYSYEQ